MTTQALESVLVQLNNSGLNISLAPAGGLAVAPASHLTADLRDLIRSRKPQLIDWLKAANDKASHSPDLPDKLLEWKELAEAYNAHHFSCGICIAAGRGSCYGQRCGVGMSLWRAYCE